MKIGAFYNTVDRPWGGINTFFRNFVMTAKESRKVELVKDFADADLILSAGHYRGPGQTIKPMHLINISKSIWKNFPMRTGWVNKDFISGVIST